MNRVDVFGGLMMLSISLFLGWQALGYNFGTLQRMGPGFFPLTLSLILTAMSVALLVRGLLSGTNVLIDGIGLRGPLLVLLPPLAFGLSVRGLGFAPATLIAVLLAAGASRNATPFSIILTGLLLTVFCLVIFSTLLGVPYPLVGNWLKFSSWNF